MGRQDKLSVFISLILRHKPEAAGIRLNEHGWAEVDGLIAGINGTGWKIDRKALEEIVATDSKQRYAFNEDKTMIRANQGHSVPVDVGLEEMEPPEFLYHGTAGRCLGPIMAEGLRPMGRLYVHLSKDIGTAIKVGKRHGEPVVLKVLSGDMFRDGYQFYLSQNGVWLTEGIGCRYIELEHHWDR